MYVYFQTTNDMNEGNTRNYQSVGIKHRKNITLFVYWDVCASNKPVA